MLDGSEAKEALHSDALLLQPRDVAISTLQVWMELDLADNGRDDGGFEDRFHMWTQEAGHTDCLGFAGVLNGFHGFPGISKVFISFGKVGAMDEVAEMRIRWFMQGAQHLQINVIQL